MLKAFVATSVWLPRTTGLRLSTLESEEELCAGSSNSCNGNQCCEGFEGSNSLTFPCPNADETFDGCQTTQRYTFSPETLSASELVRCPGSCEWCSAEQCCPGFVGSNYLTFPCSTAPTSYAMCQTTTRITDSSACEADTGLVAHGDSHVISVTGEKFAFWSTGWSTFVQIPKDVEPDSEPQLVVTGNVLPYDDNKCAPTFLQHVKMSGSILEYHEILVRAGPLDGAVPFGVSLDGSGFKPIDASSSSKIYVGPFFSMYGMISDDESDVWGPDARLQINVGALLVTVKQHTEDLQAGSRSMLDLSVDGLRGVDSVGGLLGVDSSLTAEQQHPECVEVSFIEQGVRSTRYEQSRAVGFHSPRSNYAPLRDAV